jgi:hypothetical protein
MSTVFNPAPRISVLPLAPGSGAGSVHHCLVLDDVLADPQALVDWAREQAFGLPRGYPYPGQVLDAPDALRERVADHFALHTRSRLGGRRTLDLTLRFSMVTTPPQALEPRQWQCHRDRVSTDPTVLFAASVLYLFHTPALGGTSFYVPKQSAAETDRLLADSQLLDAATFAARYGLQPGYMAGSNAYFERVARVPAAWNRMIVYDGSVFHSADVDSPALLHADPARGRLTLNGFFTCKRTAHNN